MVQVRSMGDWYIHSSVIEIQGWGARPAIRWPPILSAARLTAWLAARPPAHPPARSSVRPPDDRPTTIRSPDCTSTRPPSRPFEKVEQWEIHMHTNLRPRPQNTECCKACIYIMCCPFENTMMSTGDKGEA